MKLLAVEAVAPAQDGPLAIGEQAQQRRELLGFDGVEHAFVLALRRLVDDGRKSCAAASRLLAPEATRRAMRSSCARQAGALGKLGRRRLAVVLRDEALVLVVQTAQLTQRVVGQNHGVDELGVPDARLAPQTVDRGSPRRAAVQRARGGREYVDGA